MKLLALSCNHCGASLDVPTNAKFVTCAFCSSRLVVQRTSSAAYTEVLEATLEHTERIADDVRTLKLQNELERLDREWGLEREGYLVRGSDGHQSVPSAAGSLFGSMLSVVVGMVFVGGVLSIEGPGFMLAFGAFIIAMGIGRGVVGGDKAGRYRAGQAAYTAARMDLLKQLDGDAS